MLILYINYFTLFISKLTYSNTARLHDSSDVEYFEITYRKWDDLRMIIDYLWEYIR